MISKKYRDNSTKNILLLTATITPPNNVPLLQRTDPELRLQDYGQALKFYLSLLNQQIHGIVFAENSNSDISRLRDLVDQEGINDGMEFMVFNGLDYPPSHGRAYGEFKIIDYAMQNSYLINSQDQKKIIWKVTGRYIVRNLGQIISKRPKRFDVYYNARTIPKRWADMFLMGWTHHGYQKCLQNIHHQLIADPNCLIQPEEVFIDLLGKPRENVNFVRRYNHIPLIDGIRGSDNQNYSAGRNLFKFYLRSVGCKLFPWLWI
jgi:hypothetical protein